MSSLFFSLCQVEKRYINGYTWRGCLLPSFIPIFCHAIFHRKRWVRAHSIPKQKNIKFLQQGPSWGETIFASLHHTGRVESSLWESMGSIQQKKIHLWPFSNPSSWSQNFPKSSFFSMTMTASKKILHSKISFPKANPRLLQSNDQMKYICKKIITKLLSNEHSSIYPLIDLQDES